MASHPISLYRPGSPAHLEQYVVELGRSPSYPEVQAAIIDYFPPGQCIEMLRFLDERGVNREMFHHDLGMYLGAEENDLATAIWRRQWPEGHPNRARNIYGIAIVFDRPIWPNCDH